MSFDLLILAALVAIGPVGLTLVLLRMVDRMRIYQEQLVDLAKSIGGLAELLRARAQEVPQVKADPSPLSLRLREEETWEDQVKRWKDEAQAFQARGMANAYRPSGGDSTPSSEVE